MADGPGAEPLGFDGRVAIVTGAGGGLGRAHALMLAERGCRVVVNDVGLPHGDDVPVADVVVAEIIAGGGEAVADTNDVVSEGAGVVATAVAAFGGVDIVVNNAGIGAGGPIGPGAAEAWRPTIDITLQGSIAVTAAAWPHLVGVRFRTGRDDLLGGHVRRVEHAAVLGGEVGALRPDPFAGRTGPPGRHRRQRRPAVRLHPAHPVPPPGPHGRDVPRSLPSGSGVVVRRSGCATRRARCRGSRSPSAVAGRPVSSWPRTRGW